MWRLCRAHLTHARVRAKPMKAIKYTRQRERFRDWLLVSPTKERQNESYLEAAVGTERCNAVAWQRRVGERLGRLTLSKHWRVGLARSLKADRTLAHALIEVPDCRNANARMKILAVDVGGTHVKILATGEKQKREIVASSRARVRRGGWRDDRRSCAAGRLRATRTNRPHKTEQPF